MVFISSISTTNNIESAARTRPVHKTSGNFGRVKVHKRAQPSQAIEDLMEELSAAHSEHFEAKKVEDSQKEEELHGKDYEKLIAQIEKEYPPNEEPQQKHIKDFIQRLHERTPQNQQELEQSLADITKDKAEAFAILNYTLKQAGTTLSTSVQTLLEKTQRTMAARDARTIQAGINTIALSKQLAPRLNVESAALQASYQSLVSSYQGILPALTDLAQNKQLDKFGAMTDFLMQAAAKDLAATNPSTQKQKLLHVLAEFQGVKIFNTLLDWSDKTYARFQTKLQEKTTLTKPELFSKTLQYVAKPENFNKEIKHPLRHLAPSDRVLVLQELRSSVRSLPDYLFRSGEAEKARALFPLQNEIDKLVFEQDA